MKQNTELVWRRTYGEETAYDFVCERNGRSIGRIYRMFCKQRWQWFAYHSDGTGSAGVADSMSEAVIVIETTK